MKKLYLLAMMISASSFFSQATVPPYTQDFTTFPLTGWYLGYTFNANVGSGPTNSSVNYWKQKPFMGDTVANDQSLCVELYTSNISYWAVTNAFDLSGNDYEITFDAAVTNSQFNTNPNGPAPQIEATDKFKVLINTDGTTWQELRNWDNPNITIPNQRTKYTIDVSAYKGSNVKFALYASDGTVFNAAASYRLFVDNFKIQVKANMAVGDAAKTEFGVYPNPTADRVTIRSAKNVRSLNLFDTAGRMIKSAQTKEMNLADYPKGIYILKATFTDNISISQKVIKK